jgi:hypothetical protein
VELPRHKKRFAVLAIYLAIITAFVTGGGYSHHVIWWPLAASAIALAIAYALKLAGWKKQAPHL